MSILFVIKDFLKANFYLLDNNRTELFIGIFYY